jgi:hypothetical protein
MYAAGVRRPLRTLPFARVQQLAVSGCALAVGSQWRGRKNKFAIFFAFLGKKIIDAKQRQLLAGARIFGFAPRKPPFLGEIKN